MASKKTSTSPKAPAKSGRKYKAAQAKSSPEVDEPGPHDPARQGEGHFAGAPAATPAPGSTVAPPHHAGVAAPAPQPVVVEASSVTSDAPALRKQELLNAVTQRSGMKRQDVKPVVEAMLEVLGTALTEGRDLKLEPLGKTKITRVKQRADAQVSMIRLRQRKPLPADREKVGALPLARTVE